MVQEFSLGEDEGRNGRLITTTIQMNVYKFRDVVEGDIKNKF